MSRTKQTIENLDDANDVLYDRAIAQLQLQKIDGNAAEQVALIQKDAEQEGKQYREQIAELEEKLLSFASLKKDELFPDEGKKRSATVTFGTFGYRKTSSIVIENEAKTIELIEITKKNLAQKLGISVAIERLPKIKKTALKGFDNDTLGKFGIEKKHEDIFYVETDTDAVNLQLQKAKSA